MNRRGQGSDEFVREIDSAIRFLEKYPERHPFYYLQFRRFLTARFPYKLFYVMQTDRVIIFRILHVKRDHTKQL